MNRISIFVYLTFGIIYPISALASDFVVLQVGLGTFVIAGLLMFLGLKAASSKDREKTIALMFLILVLTAIGIGLVNEESGHMGEYDYFGLLGITAISGLLSFIIPLFSQLKDRGKGGV